MPKLTPYQSQQNHSKKEDQDFELLEETAREVFQDTTKVKDKDAVKELFNSVGLSLEATARKMQYLMEYSSEESTQYKVVQDLLKIHGALEHSDENSKNISINFTFQSPVETKFNVEEVGQRRLDILIPRIQ